ncbi:MAG: tRNA epoxyqueuosine(34) reductase QueG [Gemmatimonadota bacterium]|nr:tRNA epoxyqueuosine(34) reductase QueG [Gemmatimonadota bacterium]
MSLESRLKAEAEAIGFLACGVATLEPSDRGTELDAWLGAGYGGTMRYLHRQAARRKAPATIVPGALRAVMVLENYLPPEWPHPSDAPAVATARYAAGSDYHVVTARRLQRLADWLMAQGATTARVFVDAGPVPERELARRAGLGWIGKNTMLIRPGVGSWFFIGSVFTDLPLEPDSPHQEDRCGSCTRCLDACPTEAFVEAGLLDATKCISFLTIEHKGPIPDALAPQVTGWAFGCDICNEVCPWNVRFAEPTAVPEFFARAVPDHRDPGYFARMEPEEFAAQFGDTPFERPGLEGMRRNWAAAFGSIGYGPGSKATE